MSTQTGPSPRSRTPLTRDRVLHAAIEHADRDGLASLTMRNLAAELGVEAMSLYHHVENKETLLAGVVEVLVERIVEAVERIDAPPASEDWRTATRMRILTAREVLLRHPWAPELIESRSTMSPATLRYFEGLVAMMRQGGFTYDLAHHALHALGSRALGFTQELFTPAEPADQDADEELLQALSSQVPHLTEMMVEISHDPDSSLGWCDDQSEFEFGLDLLLDGLDRLRTSS